MTTGIWVDPCTSVMALCLELTVAIDEGEAKTKAMIIGHR
jgi:hypothetical protein